MIDTSNTFYLYKIYFCLETPLTFSTTLKQPAKVIMALINGGALLDFRTKDGLTALHKAVERNNLEALKVYLGNILLKLLNNRH